MKVQYVVIQPLLRLLQENASNQCIMLWAIYDCIIDRLRKSCEAKLTQHVAIIFRNAKKYQISRVNDDAKSTMSDSPMARNGRTPWMVV